MLKQKTPGADAPADGAAGTGSGSVLAKRAAEQGQEALKALDEALKPKLKTRKTIGVCHVCKRPCSAPVGPFIPYEVDEDFDWPFQPGEIGMQDFEWARRNTRKIDKAYSLWSKSAIKNGGENPYPRVGTPEYRRYLKE